MLPTFPKIVERRAVLNQEQLQRRIRAIAPLFGQIDKHAQFEGNGSRIVRHDHSVDQTDLTASTAEFTLERMDLRDFTLSVVDSKLEEAAQQFATAFMQLITSTMDRVTEKTGLVVDAKGRPIDADFVLEVLDKIELSFDEHGDWTPPTVLGGATILDNYRTVTNTNEFEKRLSQLLVRKFNEHRSREADRVLAG